MAAKPRVDTELIEQLAELLQRTGLTEIEVTSFTHPKWIPNLADAEEVTRASNRDVESLRRAGFLVTAIRPPTVPDGEARLRVTLDDGRDAGLFLDRGPILRGGDRLAAEDGSVIEGLYACGNCSAPTLPCYPGPGSTLGPSMTFGYQAAKAITGFRDWYCVLRSTNGMHWLLVPRPPFGWTA